MANHARAKSGRGGDAKLAHRSKADMVYWFGLNPRAKEEASTCSASVAFDGRWLAHAFNAELK